MDKDLKKVLQQQLEFYSGLIKEHEAAKKCQMASVYQLSKNSKWKDSSFPYKTIQSSDKLSASYSKYTYNKCHAVEKVKSNRTVLFRKEDQEKYKLTLDKTKKPTNVPSNKVIFQRAFLNKEPMVQLKKFGSSPLNISDKIHKMKSESCAKASSNSLALIKEIESLTQMLKKTSESKSKTVMNAKEKNSVQKLKCNRGSNQNTISAFTKCNVQKNKILSPNTDLSKISTKNNVKNVNTTFKMNKKLSNALLISDFKNKYNSKFGQPDSVKLDKFCYKKVNLPKNSTTFCPQNSAMIGKKLKDNVVQSISKLSTPKSYQSFRTVSNNLCYDAAKFKEFLAQKVKRNSENKPLLIASKINKRNTKISPKPPNTSVACGEPKLNSKFKRVNAIPSPRSTKSSLLRKALQKTSPSCKNLKRNMNSKFKLINKPNSSCSGEKMALLDISKCHKNSPLIVDKSDPVFNLLNDSTVDKLEKDLLAISTALTSTPRSHTSGSEKIQTSCTVNSKLLLKRRSLKKPKVRISKYKVVNSNSPHNHTLKNSQNFKVFKRTKRINPKYNFVRTNAKLTNPNSFKAGKSILVKRLYKSKNAIINKNVSPTNHSAKMIKSKYFSIKRKRLPNEKPSIYAKMPLYKPKAYLSAKMLSKRNKYWKASTLAHQRTMRRCSYYHGHSVNGQFSRNISKNKLAKKLCIRNGNSPVVFIRGLKYSLNSSGKTLRKLPAHNLTRIHHRFIINGKGSTRTFESRMKAVTPNSANLASRVLNRSITRVLSASTKKELRKVNKYCMFYNRFGRCNRGVKCTYIHDPSKIAVCTRFLRGTCKVEGCPFSHEISPGKMAICSYFLVGACDKKDCPYRHEKLSPDAQLCKAFVQGYCPNGKECKKAHILICPKYILGNCEKGTSCAFPHPPQKVKKNVQNTVAEEKKSDDALLEKMARYFEENASSCENQSEDSVTNLFIPAKQKRLEEQPSFIPL